MPDYPIDRYPARLLSRAMLAVAKATGTDRDSYLKFKTVRIQTFETGARLTATDTTIVLTAWVPNAEHVDAADVPAPDAIPVRDDVVSDHDGRVLALCRYALKLSKEEESDDWPGSKWLELGIRWDAPAPVDDDLMMLDDTMGGEWVRWSIPDRETVSVPRLDGRHYPDAHLFALRPPAATAIRHASMRLSHLHAVGMLESWFPDEIVQMQFTEFAKMIAFTLPASHPPIAGAFTGQPLPGTSHQLKIEGDHLVATPRGPAADAVPHK